MSKLFTAFSSLFNCSKVGNSVNINTNVRIFVTQNDSLVQVVVGKLWYEMLPDTFSAGPHGLGDPNDTHLRHVEKEILIPMKIRDRAKLEKCVHEVEEFTRCCQSFGFSMVYKCRPENSALKLCLEKWYKDDNFRQECTEEYLKERSEYRSTGLSKKLQRKHTSGF